MTDNSELEIRTTAALRLIGSKQEILIVLSALASKGFKWKTNGKYYSQRDNSNRFAYYLDYLYVPFLDYGVVSSSSPGFSVLAESFSGVDSSFEDEPKPRLFDAVLGGNNPPTPAPHHRTTHP
jgi:hypothetical protein